MTLKSKPSIPYLTITPVVKKIIEEGYTLDNSQELFDEISHLFPAYGSFLKSWFNGYYPAYIKSQEEFSIKKG